MGEPDGPDEAMLAQLPTVYAVALRLDAAGADEAVIAAALGIDAASVPALLGVGRGKLAELRNAPGPGARDVTES